MLKISETMADWDEAKLEEVVHQKHAESDSKQPKTDIVIVHLSFLSQTMLESCANQSDGQAKCA